MAAITLGSTETEHITIEVLRREHQGAMDYWDGNWVICRIRARVGGFTADYQASLRSDEFHRFHEGLKFINDNLFGSAVFESMEHWIELKMTCEPNGSLHLTANLHDQPGTTAGLSFELDRFDQSHLPGWLDQLDEVEAAFPVLGSP